MANKVIYISNDDVPKKTGLEVYRDISILADLNQANILKSYREIIPIAFLANDIFYGISFTIPKTYYTVQDISAMFNNNEKLSDKVYKNSKFEIIRYELSDIILNNKIPNTATIESIDFTVGLKYQALSTIDISNINGDNFNTYFQSINDKTEFLQGEKQAQDIIKDGFYINAQYADKYYVEEYESDINSFTQFLKAESNSSSISAIITEDKLDETLLLLMQNEGQISSFANWKESKMWNPYKLAKLVNVKAVFNSIKNIFSWTPGERILNPEFGSNLKQLLYEGITDFTSEQITAEIRRCISEYEPRVNVVKIINSSDINDTENNTIQIDIIFTIPSLSDEQFKYSYKYNQYDNS